MTRTCTVVLGLALSASAAQGAFTGIQYVQGNSPAATAALGQNAVTFRAFATFDGAGDGVVNTILSTAFTNINTVGPGTIFTQMVTPFNQPYPPKSSLFAANPTLRYKTFGTIGVSDGDDPLASSVGGDPGLQITTTQIQGGWFNSDPANNALGYATANTALGGGFGVLLLQITVLTNGGSGAFVGPITPFFPILAASANGNASSVTSLITGSLSIFEQGPNGPVEIAISIPTPGALALFGVAGLASIRRRR